MAKKRGRPVSADTTNEDVLRRRERTAERTRAYRERIAQQSEVAGAIVPGDDVVVRREAAARRRGRPPMTVTDEATLRKREKTAERVRRLREKRVAALAAAAARSPTHEQLVQAEAVTEQSFGEQESAPTLTGVGLRVQDMVLAQDSNDAQLQWDATPVEEHEALYGLEGLTITDDQPEARGGHTGITRFFPTIPSSNPFFRTRRDVAEGPTSDLLQEEEAHEEWHELHMDEMDDGVSTRAFGSAVRNSQAEASDESSTYDFVSEVSEGDSSGESEAEISAHEYTVQKLYEELQGGFHGCSAEQHEEGHRQHMQEAGDNHHGLDEIFNDQTFPSVIKLPDFMSAQRLARHRQPTAAQWRAMYCGVPVDQTHPQPYPYNVCLHKEESREMEAQVASDIDSFMGFFRSLAGARQGIWYQPAPQMRQNMTNDVHLETHMFGDGVGDGEVPRPRLAMLRDVPHFLLGRVESAHDITVHILFPHLPARQDGTFRSLTNDQLSRWMDQVFHPAVYKYLGAHYTQHLPASHRHALANSRAYQVEGRLIDTESYHAQRAIGYHLQPEYVDDIWTDILDTIASKPGLADFREPQLYFSAKGTKLQFKTSPSRPTLLGAMKNFQSYLERVLDMDYVYQDRLYVDIGKEICPRTGLLAYQRMNMDEEAQVYQWKRCCLESYMEWMYDGQAPGIGQGQRYFHQNMLYEASSLTSVTPKRSKLREGGLIYSQFYGSSKEIGDATKKFPFENDGLEEMALDRQIRKGAKQAMGGRRREAKVIERAYCASKRRTQVALTDSMNKSFGIREEHRVKWSLFLGLMARLELEQGEEMEDLLVDCPEYAWCIRTRVYLDYLWRRADKFATGFEIVLARSNRELVTWEQTKMMAMFLRCLRFVFGGHMLERESALWWSRSEREATEGRERRVWYGLGFRNTLKRYGYCWLEPRFDWKKLQFLEEVTDQVLFGNSTLRGQYLRRGGQAREFFGAARQLELAMDWIDKHEADRTIRERLLGWMAHICLRQFRQDVMETIKGEIREERLEEALAGGQGFCREYLEEMLTDGVHLVSGNRSDLKGEGDLRRFLFDFDDGRARTHWEDGPYRKLYRRGLTGLGMKNNGKRLGERFSEHVWRKLYAYHWVLPYPSSEVFTQTTKEGERMWYSVITDAREGTKLETLEPKAWRWGRKKSRSGVPDEIPKWVEWEKEEWVEWEKEEWVEWEKEEWVSWIEGQKEEQERQKRVRSSMVMMRFG
ncbi:uncharacterized protein PV09_09804 [Verruconis gallopava]|uniref:Uncharacterized protein n=1 Tax=Verruconis gallopava TaxID=253628 RepID=A0A0D2AHE1_9PEZI|nr:uncharacterized protein PV09_09804 [Verruconis gallopava]KIV98358.1 hypothetical protein PV09_09804 [Verruconis gallopava]